MLLLSHNKGKQQRKAFYISILDTILRNTKTNCRRSKVMTKTLLTIGLNDKNTERQEIETGAAKKHYS